MSVELNEKTLLGHLEIAKCDLRHVAINGSTHRWIVESGDGNIEGHGPTALSALRNWAERLGTKGK